MTEAQRNDRLNALFQEAMKLLLERAAEEIGWRRNKLAPTILAIQHVEAILTNSGISYGCICHCPVIDGHTEECPVVPFLPKS